MTIKPKFTGKMEEQIYKTLAKYGPMTAGELCNGERYTRERYDAFAQLQKDNPELVKKEWDEDGMCHYSI